MSEQKSDLTSKKCVPCSGTTPRLRGKEIEPLFEKLHLGWKVVDEHHLEKEYEFPNFKQALRFTLDVGELAEQEGHHPDIYLAWGKVKLQIWTHKIHGLSESDFILAAKCDAAYSRDSVVKDF